MSERDEPGNDDGGADDGGAIVSVMAVLDGPDVPAWQARVVELLDESPAVAVEGLCWPPAGGRRLERTRSWRECLQRHVFSIHPDPCASVQVAPREPSHPAPLTLWLAEAQAPRVDDGLLLVLRHGDLLEPAEDAFWRASLAGENAIRSELVAVDRDGATRALASTVSEIRPYSEAVGRALALWKLAALVARSLERLATAQTQPTAATGLELARRPPAHEWTLLRHTALRAARAVITRSCFRRPWSIALATSDDWPPMPTDCRLLDWTDAKAYADPFLFEHEGRRHLFCEEVPTNETNGVISHTEIPHDSSFVPSPTPVLRASHHLSYPFVFTRDGEIFMIPETSSANRIELYRATTFPTDWRLEGVLLDNVHAADATLFEHDGLLWLFASIAAPDASTLDELHLFWAGELLGPWQAHPLNPIVSDVRCARPAGAIQRWGLQLVRPAQDCSRRYGWAISFQQIDALTTSAYAEHEVARVEPDAIARARAIHTFSAAGGLQAWDLRRKEGRWRRRKRS